MKERREAAERHYSLIRYPIRQIRRERWGKTEKGNLLGDFSELYSIMIDFGCERRREENLNECPANPSKRVRKKIITRIVTLEFLSFTTSNNHSVTFN